MVIGINISKNIVGIFNCLISLKNEIAVLMIWVAISAMVVVIAVKLPDALRMFQIIPNYTAANISYIDLVTWYLTSLLGTAVALFGTTGLANKFESNT